MKRCGSLVFLLFSLLTAVGVYAQSRITCQSRGRGRNYCSADTRGGVALVRQLGGAPCRQGSSWGFDGRGIWVQDGCSAEFKVGKYAGGPFWWNSGGGQSPVASQGAAACFYRRVGFQGDYFCMRHGESFPNLPRGFNDSISSIRVFPGAQVELFVDNNFTRPMGRVRQDVPDLANRRLRDQPNRTWANQISSIRVF